MSAGPAPAGVVEGVAVTGGEADRYLTFTLDGEAYALNIFHVTEILEHRTLTAVPMMPPFVRGVINLRGRAVPVIDLAVRFHRGQTTIGRRTSIIIVHLTRPALDPAAFDPAAAGVTAGVTAGVVGTAGDGGQEIGILVDAVNKVEAFPAEDIEPPPAFGAGIRTDFIAGMAKRDHDFTIVLDVDHVLSLTDLTHPTETPPA